MAYNPNEDPLGQILDERASNNNIIKDLAEHRSVLPGIYRKLPIEAQVAANEEYQNASRASRNEMYPIASVGKYPGRRYQLNDYQKFNPLDYTKDFSARDEISPYNTVANNVKAQDGTSNINTDMGETANQYGRLNQVQQMALEYDFDQKYLNNLERGMDEETAWYRARQDMVAQAAPQMSNIGRESKECRDAWNSHLDQNPLELDGAFGTGESGPTDEWCWENRPTAEYDPLREQNPIETFLLGKNLKAERMRKRAKGNADYLLGDQFDKDYEELMDDPSGAHFGLSDFVVPGLYPAKVAYHTATGDYQPGVLDILGLGGGINMARRAIQRWKQLADNAMASFGARNIHTPWDAATQFGREAKSGFMNSRIGPGSIDVYSPEGRLLESVRKEGFHTPVDETVLPWSR